MAWNMEETMDYELHPEGVYVAEVVSFTDEGEVETEFQGIKSVKHRGYYEVSTQEVDSAGTLFPPRRVYVNKSAHELARLTAFRNAVAGRKLPREELIKPFDPESLIGQRLQVQIAQEESRDGSKVYANVVGMMPVPRGAMQQRPQQQAQPAREPTAQEAHPPADDGGGDLPF